MKILDQRGNVKKSNMFPSKHYFWCVFKLHSNQAFWFNSRKEARDWVKLNKLNDCPYTTPIKVMYGDWVEAWR